MTSIKAAFDVDIPLHRLFATPTIAGLDECIVDAQLAQFDSGELEQLEDLLGRVSHTDNLTSEEN
jgi:hypothetical protein